AAAAASNLVAFAVDGELNNYFVRRKLQRMIKELKNHYIVVGFGRMGVALCEELTQQDDPFVLIERDPALAAEAQERGYLTVVGDATHEDILEQAGIHRAAGLTTCLPNDPANVFVTLTARGMRPPTHSPTSHTNSPDTPAAASSPDLEIVARSENPTTEAKLRRAGADRVICP
ncbi:MAG: NAD(P)-binding protein, partial [Pseudomonadota bacterium]